MTCRVSLRSMMVQVWETPVAGSVELVSILPNRDLVVAVSSDVDSPSDDTRSRLQHVAEVIGSSGNISDNDADAPASATVETKRPAGGDMLTAFNSKVGETVGTSPLHCVWMGSGTHIDPRCLNVVSREKLYGQR